MKATFGVPALLAICLVAAQPEEPVQPTVQEAAVVVIGVSGDDVTASPSVIVVNRGQAVEWQLAEGSGIERFQVRFQSGRPFGVGPSQRGIDSSRGTAAHRARGVVAGDAEVGARYKYDIRVWRGPGQPLFLDPEVEIGTGRQSRSARADRSHDSPEG